MSTVTYSGPLFDGIAEDAAAELTKACTDQVAGQAFAEWMTNLNESIKHPTPYYETQINIRDEGPDTKVVNDRGVIYGWWLEGIGSRNAPVTRFKGYFSRRKAVEQVEARIPELVDHVKQPYLDKMRGA
jgi:hypothetical protein